MGEVYLLCDYVDVAPVVDTLFDYRVYGFSDAHVTEESETFLVLPFLHLLGCVFLGPSYGCAAVTVGEYGADEGPSHVSRCAKDLVGG